MLNDEKRTTEEAYTSATMSSNLRVEADRRGDADILIAAGWSKSRIGGALLRLHSEFDGAEKVRMATAADFLAGTTGKPRDRRHAAGAQAHAFNLHETGLLLQKLKSLPDVRAQLALQLTVWKVEQPEEVAVGVLRWWLSQPCPVCKGTKYQVAEGTGRHNGKACRACQGTGLRESPHGQAGRRLANFMDDCVQRARDQIGKRLRISMDRN
ncbi:hypothetical protein GT347_20220 [Xylophilus rhododendri]|uniref:Antitermination protein n=1 Tax=Xylophilus rhododendri TaxID=2697032 RepID=A0A857J7S9_9BURK|nr:hypothetical protein [Xylophilus rhododendri]QHJ00101.1 hypothetical protein GT347_20220 [Xylophilus rhododendri]